MNSKPPFPIHLLTFIGASLLLQGCSTMFSGVPDDIDGAYDQTPFSQSAPQAAPQVQSQEDRADSSLDSFQQRVAQAIRHQDIVLGMTQNDVLASWGRPRDVQVAGDATYGNARWVYTSGSTTYDLGDSRSIYFEGGRVVGWQSGQSR